MPRMRQRPVGEASLRSVRDEWEITPLRSNLLWASGALRRPALLGGGGLLAGVKRFVPPATDEFGAVESNGPHRTWMCGDRRPPADERLDRAFQNRILAKASRLGKEADDDPLDGSDPGDSHWPG